MSDINSTLALQAATIQSPITFAAADTPAEVRAHLDTVIALISQEGTDGLAPARGYLDEMSPICRTYLYKILTDLKTATVDA